MTYLDHVLKMELMFLEGLQSLIRKQKTEMRCYESL